MRHLARILTLALALTGSFALLAGTGCGASSGQSQSSREFDSAGVVRSIDLANKTITIAHEDVPGYMPAMTMPFELESAAQAEGFSAGDEVRFRFSAPGGGRHIIVTLSRR